MQHTRDKALKVLNSSLNIITNNKTRILVVLGVAAVVYGCYNNFSNYTRILEENTNLKNVINNLTAEKMKLLEEKTNYLKENMEVVMSSKSILMENIEYINKLISCNNALALKDQYIIALEPLKDQCINALNL